MRFKMLIFCLLFSLQLTADAQQNVPLAIQIDGQIFRRSAGDIKPMFSGCDLQDERLRVQSYSLTQSSGGEWVAFMALPEDRLYTAPESTGNLRVCNLWTGETYALSSHNAASAYQVSEGVFSPDGSRIIWTETDNTGQEATPATLFVHDFATHETRILNENLLLTEYCGIGTGAPRVIWGEQGIAAGYFRFDPANPCNGDEEIGFSYYAEDGTLLNAFPVENATFGGFEWLEGDEPRIAYFARDPESDVRRLYSLNMLTGEVQPEKAVLEAFIPGSAASAGAYLVAPDFSGVLPQMKLPLSGTVLETPADAALSPDGNQMAVLIGRMLYLSENGTLKPALWNQDNFDIYELTPDVPDYHTGQLEIAWANPAYRLVPVPETVCPQVAPLPEDGNVFVIPGLGRNNVRAAPDANAVIIGKLAEADEILTIESYDLSTFQDERGDVCSGGIRWREIWFDGKIGWTAESQDDTYFLTDGFG